MKNVAIVRKVHIWQFVLGVLLVLCGLAWLALIVYIMVAIPAENEVQEADRVVLLFSGWGLPICGGAVLLYLSVADLLHPGTFDRGQRVKVVRIEQDRMCDRELLQFVGLVGRVSHIRWPGQSHEVCLVKFPGGREKAFRTGEGNVYTHMAGFTEADIVSVYVCKYGKNN